MRFLRTISTRRLIALVAATAVAVIGVTAVAMAMSGGGPKPEPKPLANAVHDALAAPAVSGISARVKFTNHLIDGGSIEGVDPLLTGASGRLWASPDGGGKLRLELQSEGGGGDSQVLVEDRHFEIYDGNTETVYRGTLPEPEGKDEADHGTPSLAEVEEGIVKAEKHADLSGAVPSDVAGQPTYTLRVAPKHDGGLLGGLEVAWDASNGVPLRAAIYSSENDSPVIQLEATDVSFEAVPASVFKISPPPGAEVVDLAPGGDEGEGEGGKEPQPLVGAEAVQEKLDFQLVSPPSLAGLPKSEVRGIEVDGKTAALTTYGEGLGGIAVIESASEPGKSGGPDEAGLNLPKVSINGVTGEELDTALGTVVRFSRDGVDYLVIGSVPPAAAEAAARAL